MGEKIGPLISALKSSTARLSRLPPARGGKSDSGRPAERGSPPPGSLRPPPAGLRTSPDGIPRASEKAPTDGETPSSGQFQPGEDDPAGFSRLAPSAGSLEPPEVAEPEMLQLAAPLAPKVLLMEFRTPETVSPTPGKNLGDYQTL